MIKEVCLEDLKEGLRLIGLQEGDAVVVHSSISSFGCIKNPLQTILEAFQNILGKKGCLIVPIFNFAFGKGEAYDLRTTKSSVGIFSEYVRTHQESRVLFNTPFHSYSAIGNVPAELLSLKADGSFSENSIFKVFYDLNLKTCLFGTDFAHATLFHYVEEKSNVPYRFHKTISGKVKGLDGVVRHYSFDYFARRHITDHSERFKQEGLEMMDLFGCKTTQIGLGKVFLFSSKPFVDVMSEVLRKNPNQFLHKNLKNSIV